MERVMAQSVVMVWRLKMKGMDEWTQSRVFMAEQVEGEWMVDEDSADLRDIVRKIGRSVEPN